MSLLTMPAMSPEPTAPTSAPAPLARDMPCAVLAEQYQQTRELTCALVAPLSDADASAQSMVDASPAKWHLAHTTWFFESFILRDNLADYQLYNPHYPYLFNSYYEAEGARHARGARGLLTRPSLAEVLGWRAAVDAAMLAAMGGLSAAARGLVVLGIAHEQQHQELLLTDILHLFAQNPLAPAVWESLYPNQHLADSSVDSKVQTSAPPLQWVRGAEGVVEIGHPCPPLDSPTDSLANFAFDCETPRHSICLAPHALANRTVTNSEWQAFISDGGYDSPALWLSDGWAWRCAEEVTAPLYWREDGLEFTLAGLQPRDPNAPVSHISFYEADAYARWAEARLPCEGEWEAQAALQDSASGNQLDGAGAVRALSEVAVESLIATDRESQVESQLQAQAQSESCRQMFGNVWEWSGSAYRPYPGFAAAAGAVGEYNGKFMSSQFTLRGGSCATPRGHVRATYRNFFYPHQRWQFTGLRLAKDL